MKKKILTLILCLILLLSLLPSCTSYPEETRMAKEYLGMTFGEVKSLWGSDCTLGGDLYDGAKKGVCYEDGRTPYIFLFDTEITDITSLPDDAIVTLVRAESGKGKPCDAFESEVKRGKVTDKYYSGHTQSGNGYWANGFTIQTEIVTVFYYFTEKEPKEGDDPLEVKAFNRTVSSFAYEVSITPEEYRQKQYYHDTTDEELNWFYYFGIWPPEDWKGNTSTDIPYNFYIYYLDYGQWSDENAINEYIKSETWPTDAYAPPPYDDLEFVYFRTEHGFWPPENWDYLPIDPASGKYHSDYGEWADPEAYEEFMETGHWPEDAFVPYPFSDPELLNEYNRTGEWPEGTDLSALPEKTQWEE